MSKNEHPCAVCKKPTDFKGWVFESVKGKSILEGKKKYIWWCKEHFIAHMFNLYPFVCTDECRENLAKKLGLVLRPENTYVWMDMISVMVEDEDGEKIEFGGGSVSVPMKFTSPKCSRCGCGMTVVEEAVAHF